MFTVCWSNRSRTSKSEKMKKIVLLTLLTVLWLPLQVAGQNLDDALRYSRHFTQGSARYNAMSGAFTALGGDVSAIAVNPAAAGVFRSTEITVTPILLFRDINSSWRGFTSGSSYSGFTLANAGFASTMRTGKSGGLTSLTFAYSYNRTNNYHSKIVIDGISDDGSMTDFWAMQAGGLRPGNLAGPTWMAYDAWLIDTLPYYLDEYGSIFERYGDMLPAYGQQIKRTIENSGFTGEHNMAIGVNLGDKVYAGAGVGISRLSYVGHYVHREIDEAKRTPDFVNFSFTDHFNATGTGWNFKFGVIARPVESLRLGVAFTTPTTYSVSERYYYNLTAHLDYDTPSDPTDDLNPEVSLNNMSYSYRVTTPWRLNAGLAYQIGNIGLVSAEYELIDYANARLSHGADGYNFAAENSDLTDELRMTGNLKIGGEVRLGPLYLRGGYSYHASSFDTGTLNEHSSSNGYSAGAGYRMDNFYLDVAMVWLNSHEAYMMYPGDYREIPIYNSHATDITSWDKYLSVTLGWKF